MGGATSVTRRPCKGLPGSGHGRRRTRAGWVAEPRAYPRVEPRSVTTMRRRDGETLVPAIARTRRGGRRHADHGCPGEWPLSEVVPLARRLGAGQAGGVRRDRTETTPARGVTADHGGPRRADRRGWTVRSERTKRASSSMGCRPGASVWPATWRGSWNGERGLGEKSLGPWGLTRPAAWSGVNLMNERRS